ncbi:MAG TPA: SAM-dependent methyltransferase [Verrucomicrobiales bacterium]|nr:SAM-dependent methyltransferase [Verrucomicrobiales bacterium]
MPLDFPRARPLLQKCDLPKLFIEELGWEPARQKLTLRAGETDYAFTAVAEKRGFTAWLCESPGGGLPDHATRLKLDRKLSETSFEHLIVFVTADRASQSWMWVRREQGKPLAARTHEYHRGQPGDSLLQKLQILYVSLEEEEAGLSTVAVAGRARAAFDIERVTKAFYRDFDTHRKAFLKFIDGIGEVADCEWYASVMLNRLMFVYFIQRKGFLDGDHDYLRHRLDRCKKEQGKDKFYTFYRYFLLRLFHEGFGKRRQDRAPDLEKLLGNIPYLNGGLFDVHELEKPERYGKDIQIPDKAFERIFDYFDQYQWHLDERPLRKDDEINPDVLGYIFEKYINQKQMGAYYTKEDITEYISKNTVLPFLFDAARAKCKVAFENTDGPTVWSLLEENPDRYIYPAVRHGTDKKLPPEISVGLDTTKPDLIERRKAWNKAAPTDYALPTEIWREVVARRQRCEEVRKKLASGEVREVNDFITLNLDLRQFAQDVLQSCEGPDLLMAFWNAITTITVLDPTGGSGAFIFAALNILEPLYEACLDRMEAFLAEWGGNGRKTHPNYHKKFTEVLARVDAHPNRRYFVLKSIILNNLYAVDIMEEAVEICKLRLFLKLAAQVEPDATKDNLGIEPLPDIDFNIRAGNTLVGYATAAEVRRCMKEFGDGQMKLLDEDDLNSFARFNARCADVEQAFSKFRQLQTEGDGSVPAADKQELQKRLKALEDELNGHLAGEYGVKVGNKAAYAKWLKSHQPFHWFVQFYGILKSGGFDVIIGNPPYVEFSRSGVIYRLPTMATSECDNLWAFVIERSLNLTGPSGRMSLITPLSLVSSDRFGPAYKLLTDSSGCATFLTLSGDAHPSVLFSGVKMSYTIFTYSKAPEHNPTRHLFFSKLYRWLAAERDNLFSLIEYHPAVPPSGVGIPFKIGSELAARVIEKISTQRQKVANLERKAGVPILYHRIVRHFVKVLLTAPFFSNERDGEKKSEDYKLVFVQDENAAMLLRSFLVSSTYYVFFIALSDAYHCGRDLVLEFPIGVDSLANSTATELRAAGIRHEKDLFKNSVRRRIKYKATGWIEYDEFYPRESKPILDEIDTVLAGHYGFTAEELDFILNYDIKYRMGRDTGEEEE